MNSVESPQMLHVITAINKLSDASEILSLVHSVARDNGALRQSYHFTPAFNSQTSAATYVDTEGYSDSWVELYQNEAFRKGDPIPDHILAEGKAKRWSEAIEELEVNEAANRFFRSINGFDLRKGVGFPLYGPRNRHGYATLALDREITSADEDLISIFKSIWQAAHEQICYILRNSVSEIKLSRREAQVIGWVAHGKSNPDIGTILGISAETVSTYLKRIYDKLESRDRVGATIRALQMGLITL